MANIPPPGSLAGVKRPGNLKHGDYARLRAALKTLEVGAGAEGPITWVRQAGRVAGQLGIHVVTRRVEGGERVMIYRDR